MATLARAAAAVASALAVGTQAAETSRAAQGDSVGADGLSFLATGDWGGASDEQPTTEGQVMAGESMAKTSRQLGASFTLMMGDNFYANGIDHDSGAWSKRFLETFEQVYAAPLPGMQFYAMAGNHDYGEGRPSNVSAQLDYSTKSSQWKFPSLWYKLQREFQAGGERRTLDLLVLDTVVLCGRPGLESYIDEELQFVGGRCDPNRPGELRERIAEDHWAWVERELAASDADYLWVVGHYPLWSVGNDGSTPCLIERLEPMLHAHGAHYMSGHDHMLEHFRKGDFHSFVVGAGKECCYPPSRMAEVPEGLMQYMTAGTEGKDSQPPVDFPVYGGYASATFGAEAVEVNFYAHNGAVLYKAPLIPRRNRAALAANLAAAKSWAALSAFLPVALVTLAAFGLFALLWRRTCRGPAAQLRDEQWHQEAKINLLG